MSLFIGRLAHGVTEKDLQDLFSKYGPITRVNCKGNYGFVIFEDEGDAKDALKELQDTELLGSRINVEWSKSSGRYTGRKDRRNGSGGGFRRSYGRRRSHSRDRNRYYSRSPDRDRRPSYRDRLDRERDYERDRDRDRDYEKDRERDYDRDRDRDYSRDRNRDRGSHERNTRERSDHHHDREYDSRKNNDKDPKDPEENDKDRDPPQQHSDPESSRDGRRVDNEAVRDSHSPH